jgi:hypothetical protein
VQLLFKTAEKEPEDCCLVPDENNMLRVFLIVYNPQKGRLETIDAAITHENTTWFEDCVQNHGIHTITDFKGGLLIRELGNTYPPWIYDVSRADIGYHQRKGKEIHRMYG